MKEKLLGKKSLACRQAGLSTLEILIAFAIISLALVGAISGNFSAQYWTIVGRTSNEGLYKAKTLIEETRSKIKQDFYSATTTKYSVSLDPNDPSDNSCINGGLCYFSQGVVVDNSSCSKIIESNIEWKVNSYPTTTTKLTTTLTNSNEIISRGGDCILNTPFGDWSGQPQTVGEISFNPGKQINGIDVLHGKIYIVSNTYPSLTVLNTPNSVGSNPTITGSYDLKINGFSVKINAIDTIEDLSTGRKYAFVAVATTTKQLAVFDVTDPNNPELKNQATLLNVDQFGSYPEGYRLFAYGNRLYITTRETSGNEFHIFDITTPTLPNEIGSGYELNRTVNDLVVREQKVGGILKRYVFLASDSDIKELAVLDVTSDSISEVSSVNLSGIYDGMSIYVIGHKAFFGRKSNPTGPELFVFDIYDPSNLVEIGSAEVSADVTTIKVSGKFLYAFTNKPNEEFQVWDSDYTKWNPSILNSGRLQKKSFPNLSLLGLDIESDWLYLTSNNSVTDKISVIYKP